MLGDDFRSLPPEFYPSGRAPPAAEEPQSSTRVGLGDHADEAWLLEDGDSTCSTTRHGDNEQDGQCCYVCLDDTGPFIANFCACRNALVHRRCLLEMLKRAEVLNHRDLSVLKGRIRAVSFGCQDASHTLGQWIAPVLGRATIAPTIAPTGE